MKKLLSLFVLVLIGCSVFAQVDFNKYFTGKTLRVDVQLGGTADKTDVYLSQILQEKYYAGPMKNLIDPFNYGAYKYSLYDIKTGNLIFSKGFCSLYNEWVSTPEAKKVKRAFYHSLNTPYPKNKVRLVLEERRFLSGEFDEIFSYDIDPSSYLIGKEKPRNYNVTKIHFSGKSVECLDIAFLAEGYTIAEMDKFRKDVKRITDYMLSLDVYKPFANNINIWAVESPSADSGTDNPGKKVYKNTVMNSSFYTFDVERYLTTLDYKSVSDVAACAPHDAIFVLVNTAKYGGGGFYNFYGLSSADHFLSEKVSVHEFGHSFAGLADEYYTSSVATEDYYNLENEPWEPNITTNVDFDSKWKDMIKNGTPVPTPRIKKYRKKLGMFEGGGYMSKGVYSPVQDCVMKSNQLQNFCPVCSKAIQEMIKFYMDKK